MITVRLIRKRTEGGRACRYLTVFRVESFPMEKKLTARKNSFKEDKVMEDIVFRRGLVNRSKGRIRIEENMVTLTVPNKWAGVRTERIPVAHIASVEGVTVYHYQRPLAAVLFLMLGIERVIKEAPTFESIVGFALLLIIVAGLFLKFKEGVLRLTTTAGQTKTVFFFMFDEDKAYDAAAGINAVLTARMNDTNMRRQTDRIVDAINRK